MQSEVTVLAWLMKSQLKLFSVRSLMRTVTVCALLLLAGLSAACMREKPMFGSISHDRRCSVTVSYVFEHVFSLRPQLLIFVACDADQWTVYRGESAWEPAAAEFEWSQDSSLLTVIACSTISPPKIFTYDVRSRRMIDAPAQVEGLRAQLRTRWQQRAPVGCDMRSDPLLWACCSKPTATGRTARMSE